MPRQSSKVGRGWTSQQGKPNTVKLFRFVYFLRAHAISRSCTTYQDYETVSHDRDSAKMASAMNSSSHARTRSLRSNTLELKRPLTTPSASIPGPSSIKLFITNVRLLDLDLREDWPDITPATFSTKDQKKRIQSVEWALYHLFCLWDAEEARDVRALVRIF